MRSEDRNSEGKTSVDIVVPTLEEKFSSEQEELVIIFIAQV